MPIQLGEHAIITLMRQHFTPMPDALPFGDDVSTVPIGEGEVAVLKTDMLVAQTDVPPTMTLWQAARKAAIAPISDFAAKGAKPIAATVALGLPEGFTTADFEALAQGLNSGAQEYGVYIVGGDTAQASNLTIAVHLYGTAKKQQLMLRSGAQSGDILAVTGFFGNPPAGLCLLLKNDTAPEPLGQTLLDSVLMPKARLAEGLALAATGAVTSAMDSSDGLAWCLHELAAQSEVGFEVSDLPLAAEAAQFAQLNGIAGAGLALYGGEEYELVLTVKPQLWLAAQTAVASVGGALLPIGIATSKRHITYHSEGQEHQVEPRGYEHFKS